MKLLYELEQMNDIINISQIQKTVLLICAISATPVQAYEATTGNESLISARNSLLMFGYVNLYNSELTLTDKGRDALIDFNLVDDANNPTEEGQQLINNYFPNYSADQQ